MKQKLKEKYDEVLNIHETKKGTLEPILISSRELYDPDLVVNIANVLCPLVGKDLCYCSSGETDPQCLCSVVLDISNAVLEEVMKFLKRKEIR